MDEDTFRANAILTKLPAREFDGLARHLQLIEAQERQQAYDPGDLITDIYFPLSSVYSLVAVTDERIAVEVATIGREGMVGLPVYLGAASSPQAAFCQISGAAARLGADAFRAALARDGALHAVMNRFTQATMVQVAQNVACNRAHTTDARAARWLLTTRDRIGRDEFRLTQEFLAQMLGVHRPTVSETAQRLQAAGLIRYRRGTVTIIDAQGLLDTSCTCYRVVKAEFDALTD